MVPLGIVLIVLGVAFIISEFFTGSGLLMGIGIVSTIAGLALLIFGRSAAFQVNWLLVTIIGIIVVGILAFIIWRIKRTYHRQVATGKEDLKGKTAIVKEQLNPEGTVLVQGELWTAVSGSGKIKSGEEVIVTGIDRLRLSVVKKEKK